jgi:hypothetical protein
MRRSLSPPPSLQCRDAQFESLGWRSHDHQFTSVDYNSYVSRRLEFFKQPYSRAALEMGGIVGRLARESIGQDVALLGPALEDGHVQALSINGEELWGDVLSDKCIDSICGVYKVEQKSGMPHHYLSATHVLTLRTRATGSYFRHIVVAEAFHMDQEWPKRSMVASFL